MMYELVKITFENLTVTLFFFFNRKKTQSFCHIAKGDLKQV